MKAEVARDPVAFLGRGVVRRRSRQRYQHSSTPVTARNDILAIHGDLPWIIQPAPRGHLDLELHARIVETSLDHGRGRPDFAEIFPSAPPAGRESSRRGRM
jgi:hypothetical protein